MKFDALKKLWGSLNRKKRQSEAATPIELSRVYPVTTGLRIDISVPAGSEKGLSATKFVWVSPAGSSRSVKALRVLLLSN
jgi:hypothetical protein